MKNFIEAKDLNKDFEKYICIDVRASLEQPEYGKKAYQKSRIKGSFFMDLEKDLSSEVKAHGGRHPLPDMENFINQLQNNGISNDSKVVVYDDDMASAPRLWWMLKHIGVDQVKILNGGFKAWLDGDFPTETGNAIRQNISKGTIEKKTTKYDFVEIQTIRNILSGEEADTVIVDSRSPERYGGKVEPIDKIPGRIPGAINIFFMDAFRDSKIKGKEELNQIYSMLDNSKNIIVHCGSGITATANMAAMEEIGIQSTLYLGSYSDYISYHDSLVEKD